MVVDDRCQIERDVVLGHAHLSRNFNNLDLDIDLDETLRERVDVDETWVDGAREATELGDETDITLVDGLVGVGTDDAARNGTTSTDA